MKREVNIQEKKKTHKWGYKIFVLADSMGVVCDFMPYTRKIQAVGKPDFSDLKPRPNAVLHLAESIPGMNNHRLYFDSWFTSVPLIAHPASRGIWCSGTVQARRLEGLTFKSDRQLAAQGTGCHDEWETKTGD